MIDSILKEIDSKKNKKIFQELLLNLKNSICELYNIEKEIKKLDLNIEKEGINFLLKYKIIEENGEIEKFKKNLTNKNYRDIINSIGNLKLLMNNNTFKLDYEILKYLPTYREKQYKKNLENKKYKFIDLFCGSGGMSLGFSQEGYRPILANDIEEVCGETYAFNHLDIDINNIFIGDIKDFVNEIDFKLKEKADIVIGGPPCQSFSMANRQRMIDDPRNILYKYYIKVVDKVKPKFFIMENVKGMLKVADQVLEDFKKIGYECKYEMFNAKEFSVPQNRERIIYIGKRKDINVNLDDIFREINNQKSEVFTLKDAIDNLKKLEPFRIKNKTDLDTKESGKKIEINLNYKKSFKYLDIINNYKNCKLIYNHKTRYNNDRDIEIYSRMIPGDKSDSPRIADIMPYNSRKEIFKDKYFKLRMENVCKTITAHMKYDCNMYIHPNQPRGLTPREAARIQSYPDNYIFLGNYTKTYMQIGNSVPPLFSRKIAKVLKKYL